MPQPAYDASTTGTRPDKPTNSRGIPNRSKGDDQTTQNPHEAAGAVLSLD